MRFMLVSPKTYDKVCKYFGVDDPAFAMWFFGSRLNDEPFYFVEHDTTKKRLQELYFDKLEVAQREALFRASWDQYNLLHNDGTMTANKYREMLGLSPI